MLTTKCMFFSHLMLPVYEVGATATTNPQFTYS